MGCVLVRVRSSTPPSGITSTMEESSESSEEDVSESPEAEDPIEEDNVDDGKEPRRSSRQRGKPAWIRIHVDLDSG